MLLATALLVSAVSAASPPPAPPAAFFAAHREKLAAKLPAGSIAVFHAASAASGASTDPYRQSSDFWYLTGLNEPDSVAVLLGDAGDAAPRFVLFVRPRDFSAEQWTGWRAGVESAKKDFGAAEAYPIDEFWSRFPALAAPAGALSYESGGDEAFGRRLLEAWGSSDPYAGAVRPVSDASPLVGELRLVKEPLEIERLRAASRISAEAHKAAMAAVAPGRGEWDLKAAMVGLCLSRGAARMAYPPIVGSGRNSVILHYERDDEPLADGGMIVNDTACEYGMYASDVTRSYPTSGRFTPEQRKIYDIVLAAQKAGFAAVKPGAAFHEVHDATARAIIDGLAALGILSGDRDELFRSRAYQKFYVHGSSHWIGLDVHDAGSYGFPPGVGRLERYSKAQTKLAPGMALTVEPGIYIPESSTADKRWWNIGVRIEDVVLVTPQGMECLSCDAPREAADVERALGTDRRR
jgi:Xaa-Pro aminopeptidase